MRKECESFAAGIDAVEPGGAGGWWEGLGPAGKEEEAKNK